MQMLLMEMHGKQWELKKRNNLLEAAATQSKGRRGQTKLTDAALTCAVKADTIQAYGRKYSMTHCLWINSEIFLLCTNPKVNVYSKEHWISALSIEDGVKTELFEFIPELNWKLMTYEGFGGDICYILITHFFLLTPWHNTCYSLARASMVCALKWYQTSRGVLQPFMVSKQIGLLEAMLGRNKLSVETYLWIHVALTRSLPHSYFWMTRMET